MSGAQERLNLARTLAREGRYEEALQEHLWFHEHVLEEEPAFAAVRLSYALSYWAELGQAYPKARAALEAIRARAAASLRTGAGSWNTFHELASIDQWLGREERTYALFCELAQSNPALAERCAALALPCVLAARDYALAERYLGEPLRDLRIWSDLLNRTIRLRRQRPYSPAPAVKAEIGIYADNVRQVLDVLDGRGRLAEARDFHALAVRLVQATTIRDAVAAALKPGARPWFEPGRPRRRRSVRARRHQHLQS